MQYLGETSQYFTHCILGVSRTAAVITRVETGYSRISWSIVLSC